MHSIRDFTLYLLQIRVEWLLFKLASRYYFYPLARFKVNSSRALPRVQPWLDLLGHLTLFLQYRIHLSWLVHRLTQLFCYVPIYFLCLFHLIFYCKLKKLYLIIEFIWCQSFELIRLGWVSNHEMQFWDQRVLVYKWLKFFEVLLGPV
jgi:hypothetical protein